MRKSRVITAVAAVVLAALSGILVLQYVKDADDRAETDLELVEVLVASRDIPAGTSADVVLANFSTTKKFTRQSRPSTSIAPGDGESIEGRFTAAAIPAGQPLSPSLFAQAADMQNSALAISEGMQAITINVDESHGVAGLIAPNDAVNVLLTLDAKNILSQDSAAQERTAKLTAFLVPHAKVLAVGRTTTLGSDAAPRTDTNGDGEINDDDEVAEETAEQRGLITLEVTPRQAEQIAHATMSGTIYLSLNPAGSEAGDFQSPEEIVEAVNLFDQNLAKLDEVLASMTAASGQG